MKAGRSGLSAEVLPDDDGPPALDEDIAPIRFSSPRHTLVGEGTALRIDIPAPWPDNVAVVEEALARIEHDPGAPLTPTAFGALPYDRDRAATLVVPRILHTQTVDGERWVLRVRGGPASDDAEVGAHPDRPPPAEPDHHSVRSLVPAAQWCAAVEVARDRIRRGDLTKVVLARGIEVLTDSPVDAAALWNRLRAGHPGAFVFAIDGFVGASPELLVSRFGSTVRAQPMAGTTQRGGHPETDQRRAGELLTSAKNLGEHQITIDAVHETLLPSCSYLDSEATPSVVAAGPVQHLATLVEGRLSSPEPSVLRLVAELHPTPAVGGSPTEAALALQAELETADRGRYAGPVGWVDARGDGAFAVGIRSVQLGPDGAVLFAGVGVVADSDPLAELAETRAKAQTLLSAIVRP